MRRNIIGLAVLMVLATTCPAKEKAHSTMTVVNTELTQRQVQYQTSGTPGHATTDCSSNGSGTINGRIYSGGTVSGTVDAHTTTNCRTEYEPGKPPEVVTRSIDQAYVHGILATGFHVTLWCQAAWRACATLAPGVYRIEWDSKGPWENGKTVWVYATSARGKEGKIKYHYAGEW
jgi:hypothetical protein